MKERIKTERQRKINKGRLKYRNAISRQIDGQMDSWTGKQTYRLADPDTNERIDGQKHRAILDGHRHTVRQNSRRTDREAAKKFFTQTKFS